MQHEGMEVLLFDRACQAAEAVAANRPSIFIFDTCGCIPEELRLLSRFCASDMNASTRAVVLGEDANPGLTWMRDREGVTLLSAALDPELLFSTIQGLFSLAPPAAPVETDSLEHDLKDFLRLS